MRIILASQSPRRKELFEQIGIEPEVIVSDVSEDVNEFNPAKHVENLSFIKAKAVFEKLSQRNINEPFVVVGADTVVYSDGQILGKPADKREAFDMIKGIQGKSHFVYTGFTVIFSNGKTITDHSKTEVFVYPMSFEEIMEYTGTDEPYDKAGAYGIQGLFGRYVEKIIGDYNNVVGLPVSKIMQYITKGDNE